MKGKKMVGVGSVVLSKRERPIILEPFGKGLRGMTLRYPYEVRDEAEYFSDIPDMKIPSEMLKLAEHILDTKAADFDPKDFVDHYETAVVDMLKKKQAGKAVSKTAPRAASKPVGNVIDLLKRSLELEKKGGKTKSPSLVPALPKSKAKARQRA
jgi:DNA end-binding protein Ku